MFTPEPFVEAQDPNQDQDQEDIGLDYTMHLGQRTPSPNRYNSLNTAEPITTVIHEDNELVVQEIPIQTRISPPIPTGGTETPPPMYPAHTRGEQMGYPYATVVSQGGYTRRLNSEQVSPNPFEEEIRTSRPPTPYMRPVQQDSPPHLSPLLTPRVSISQPRANYTQDIPYRTSRRVPEPISTRTRQEPDPNDPGDDQDMPRDDHRRPRDHRHDQRCHIDRGNDRHNHD